jgi:hypothetical protein
MATTRLPISGLEVMLRQPTGAEDILLLETPTYDMAVTLELLARLALPANRSTIDWDTLCVTDLEVLLLLLRQMIFGDRIRTDIICPVQDCGKRIDVTFRIGEYLDRHRPGKARGVEMADEAGWFRFRDAAILFRLPTGADQLAAAQAAQPERELVQRCIRPAGISARLRRRVERAMETLAPGLSHNLQGQCRDCGAVVDMYFDVQQFVLSELRGQAAFIYEDVHLLARYYHWSQAEILALPFSRRAHYTEMVSQERSLV